MPRGAEQTNRTKEANCTTERKSQRYIFSCVSCVSSTHTDCSRSLNLFLSIWNKEECIIRVLVWEVLMRHFCRLCLPLFPLPYSRWWSLIFLPIFSSSSFFFVSLFCLTSSFTLLSFSFSFSSSLFSYSLIKSPRNNLSCNKKNGMRENGWEAVKLSIKKGTTTATNRRMKEWRKDPLDLWELRIENEDNSHEDSQPTTHESFLSHSHQEDRYINVPHCSISLTAIEGERRCRRREDKEILQECKVPMKSKDRRNQINNTAIIRQHHNDRRN